jgi:hypothetical protein
MLTAKRRLRGPEWLILTGSGAFVLLLTIAPGLAADLPPADEAGCF